MEHPAGKTAKRSMTFSEYARHRGCSPAAVTQAINEGRINFHLEGTKRVIDPEEADKMWAASRVRNISKERKSGQDTAAYEEPAQPQVPAPRRPPVGSGQSYGEARAAHEAVKANIANLEFQKRAGRYIDAERVRADYGNLCRTIRNGVMALPDRLASVVTTLTPDEAHKLMTEECNKILENLSNGIRSLQ